MSRFIRIGGFLVCAALLVGGQDRAQCTGPPMPSGPVQGGTPIGYTWVANFGGSGTDVVMDAAPAPGDGFFAAGYTTSFGQGGLDAWVVSTDGWGNAGWELAIGGANTDEVHAIAATADGGCVLAGTTVSFGAGGRDGWVVKLAANGTIDWQRTYGTDGEESFTTIAVLESGYYVGGSIDSASDQLDAWVLELDATGNVVWQKSFSGELDDEIAALAATSTGLAFVANSNSSFDGAFPAVPFFRPWFVVLDQAGEPVIQRVFDFSGGDALVDVLPLSDGGFILTGEILAMAFLRGDVWVLRLDGSGDVVWDKRFGDSFLNFVDTGRKVRSTPGGGFLVAGSTATAGAGSEDLWFLNLDDAGNLIADRTIGDTGFDNGNALVVTPTGEALLAGFVQPQGGGASDVFMARLLPPGMGSPSCLPTPPSAPNIWTAPLTVGAPEVSPVDTAVTAVASTAVATPLATGSFVCR